MEITSGVGRIARSGSGSHSTMTRQLPCTKDINGRVVKPGTAVFIDES